MSSRIIPVQPFDYVVFGATGDLTKRKLIPALYHRFKDGQFDEQSRIIGVSRSKWTDADFRKVARESIESSWTRRTWTRRWSTGSSRSCPTCRTT